MSKRRTARSRTSATLKQEGEKLTGTIASQMGEIAIEGTVVGSEIKWILNIDMGGQQVAIAFAGKVEGETMAGVFEMGGMGTAAWNAKKRQAIAGRGQTRV